MRNIFLSILSTAVLFSCSEGIKDNSSVNSDIEIATSDTPITASLDNHEKTNTAQNRGFPVRYRVKQGKIIYQYKGIQNGKEEVYFTNYGMTEIKFTHTTRENPFKKDLEHIDMITLMRDSFIYVVDLSTMNARRIDNSILFEIAKRSPTLDLDEAAQITYRMNGGEMRGIDTIIGLPCEKWFMPAQKQQEWRWNGIMLQTFIDLNRDYVRLTAIELDTLSSLPEGIFELPKNVNVQEGTSLKEWIEDLSKPIEKRQYYNFPEDHPRGKKAN